MRYCHHSKLLPLLLAFLPVTAGAQDDGWFAKEKSLWFNTSNAAGLGVKDLQVCNTADLGYRYETGSWHRMQEGADCGTLTFNTQGSAKVGKIQLWGQFSYDNITEDGTRFNTLVFDPFDERFIYNAADPVESKWKRQAYDMEFKMSVPAGKKIFAGAHLRYFDRIAAKQNDPRAESNSYNVQVSPSAVFRFGNSSLGVDVSYSHFLERSAPTLSNGSILQDVFVLRGLGNYTEDIVGSGGLNTMYYTCNAVGGHIQYALDSGLGLLIEAGGEFKPTGLRQDAVHPRDMGRAEVLDITLGVQALISNGSRQHKIDMDVLLRSTNGVEYSTKQVSGSGWEVFAESIMSEYKTLSAGVTYNFFTTNEDSFLWNFRGKASFFAKDDKYIAPESLFNYSGISLAAGVCRRFIFKRSTLAADIDLNAMKSLGGEYEYSGTRAGSVPVTEWYPADLNVLTADYLKAGASLTWLRRTASTLSYGFTFSADFLTSGKGSSGTAAGNRLYLDAGLKLVF